MNYEVGFLNGTVAQVGANCQSWCKEQHYVFFHNEHVQSLYLIAVPIIMLIIYWSFKNCDQDTFWKASASLGLTTEKLHKVLNYSLTAIILMLGLYVVYVLFWVVK